MARKSIIAFLSFLFGLGSVAPSGAMFCKASRERGVSACCCDPEAPVCCCGPRNIASSPSAGQSFQEEPCCSIEVRAATSSPALPVAGAGACAVFVWLDGSHLLHTDLPPAGVPAADLPRVSTGPPVFLLNCSFLC